MNSSPPRNINGFTLIEIMIAMTVGLILLTGIIQIYLAGRRTYTTQDDLARLQETGRYAMTLITQDLRQAGYWGENADISTIGGTSGPVSSSESCSSGSNEWGRMIARPVFSLNDTRAGYSCIAAKDYIGGDVLTVRYASPISTDNFGKDDKERLYLRANSYSGRLFTGDMADNPANALPNAPARELVAHAYYITVSHDGEGEFRKCQGISIPALARKTLSRSGLPVREELASGVEDMQFEYGLDTDHDGSVDMYAQADGVALWNEVIAVRLWLLVRNECPEANHHDIKTYRMGTTHAYTPDDGFNRKLYTSTVRLRNKG